jgi:hypothetical protein
VRNRSLGITDGLERRRLEALADSIMAEARIQRTKEGGTAARPWRTRELLRRPA